jgi:hypothetical protein
MKATDELDIQMRKVSEYLADTLRGDHIGAEAVTTVGRKSAAADESRVAELEDAFAPARHPVSAEADRVRTVVAQADDTRTDPVFLDMRHRLFIQGDPEARQAWGHELMELTEKGYGPEADEHLENVLGLQKYRYSDIPPSERPRVQFDGLIPVTAGRSAGISTPEPSRLVYLTPVAKALKLTSDDVLYDIGSGTGKAGMFFGAFTPVKRVVGIEIEPAYAQYANERVRALAPGLSNVRFVNDDALDADLSDGTAFYFYSPFTSTEQRDTVGMLADKLGELGAHRPIQVAVKGPDMRTRLQDSGVFSAETVLEDPAVWTVFRSHQGTG